MAAESGLSTGKALALVGATGALTGLLLNGVQLKEYFLPSSVNPALERMSAIGCYPEIVDVNGRKPDTTELFNPDNPDCIAADAGMNISMTVRLCGRKPLRMFTSSIGTFASGSGTSSTYVSYSLDGVGFTAPELVRAPGVKSARLNGQNLPRRYVRYINTTTDPQEVISICSFRVTPISNFDALENAAPPASSTGGVPQR